MPTDAVIYVPIALLSADAYAEALARCHAYCERCGYTVIGIARTWEEVEAAYGRREIGVLVVDRVDHLDPGREPRVEVATTADHVVEPPDQRSRRRRPRIV